MRKQMACHLFFFVYVLLLCNKAIGVGAYIIRCVIVVNAMAVGADVCCYV